MNHRIEQTKDLFIYQHIIIQKHKQGKQKLFKKNKRSNLPPEFQTQPCEPDKKCDPISLEAYLSCPTDKTIKKDMTNCRFIQQKLEKLKNGMTVSAHLER